MNLDYVVQADLVLMTVQSLGGPRINLLRWRLHCKDKGYPWPVADNYYDIEPINLVKIGQYESNQGGHSCSGCDAHAGKYNAHNDNKNENLVVVTFKDSKARIAYNRPLLIHWIMEQIEKQKDMPKAELLMPGTRHVITEKMLNVIFNPNPQAFDEVHCDTIEEEHIGTK